MGRLSEGCGAAFGRVWVGSLEGMGRVSGGCEEAAMRMWGGYM